MNTITSILHHLFVPHEKNNYKAKLLHTDFLSVYLIAALLLSFILHPYNGQVLGYATDITIDKLYQLTNEQREKNGLAKLTYNEKLAQAAQKKAQDMFGKNYWAHYSPDGTTPWSFILGEGYDYEYAGENLAKNFMFSQGVVDAWMDSPSHRENLLRKEYTEVGFATANGVLNGEETTLVVQMFGKPLTESAVTENKSPLAPAVVEAQEPQSAPTQNTFIADTNPVVNKKPSILGLSFLPAYWNLNIIFMSILMLAFVVDLYVAVRMRYIRIGGKNLIHFMFLGFIVLAIIILRNGAVL